VAKSEYVFREQFKKNREISKEKRKKSIKKFGIGKWQNGELVELKKRNHKHKQKISKLNEYKKKI